MDHFQVEGTIIGWELHLPSKNEDQFILSDVYSDNNSTSNAASNEFDFMDLSLGNCITTTARNVEIIECGDVACYSIVVKKINFFRC